MQLNESFQEKSSQTKILCNSLSHKNFLKILIPEQYCYVSYMTFFYRWNWKQTFMCVIFSGWSVDFPMVPRPLHFLGTSLTVDFGIILLPRSRTGTVPNGGFRCGWYGVFGARDSGPPYGSDREKGVTRPHSTCRAERTPGPRKPQNRNVQIRNLAVLGTQGRTGHHQRLTLFFWASSQVLTTDSQGAPPILNVLQRHPWKKNLEITSWGSLDFWGYFGTFQGLFQKNALENSLGESNPVLPFLLFVACAKEHFAMTKDFFLFYHAR